MKRIVNFVLIVTVLLLSTIMAEPQSAGNAGTQSTSQSINNLDYSSYINANKLLMFCSNAGSFAFDKSELFGYSSGLFYPYTSVADILDASNTSTAAFAAGLWLAGRVQGDLRTAIGEYSSDFGPGPMIGGTFDPGAGADPQYRVYKLYSDSMASNPNTDYNEWPVSQGAPVDIHGNPLLTGDQTLWTVFNDADSAGHNTSTGSTLPLGIEVQSTFWAFDSPELERVIFGKYKLYNKGANQISDFYISIWSDVDIGGVGDELFGCDTLSDIIYAYNEGVDAVYGVDPPATGIRVISGPVVSSPGDTADFDGKPLPDYRNMPMTSFLRYINGLDPVNTEWTYDNMRGIDHLGNPPSNGTNFQVPGDPVAGTGDLDTLGGNKKMLGSFGPLQFNPGDSQYVYFKIGVGQGANHLASVTDMKAILNAPDSVVTAVPPDQRSSLPQEFSLGQNYPNPFNSSTIISYTVPERSRVTLVVYNVIGRKVATLVNEIRPVGSHSVTWDGADAYGAEVASGIYFYRLTAGDIVRTRKMLLLK